MHTSIYKGICIFCVMCLYNVQAVLCLYIYIYIYCICVHVYNHHHHHHMVQLAWISLSLAIRLYHSLLLAGPLDYILCPYRAIVDDI